jgi:hypothetical protein
LDGGHPVLFVVGDEAGQGRIGLGGGQKEHRG